MASIRKRKKHIIRIKVRNQFVSFVENVRTGIRDHFKDFFQQEDLPHIHLAQNMFKKLEPEIASRLDLIPSASEIKRAA